MSPTEVSRAFMPIEAAAIPSTSIVHIAENGHGVGTRLCVRRHPKPVFRPREAMKRPSLLSQILALNLLMVTVGIFVASVASGLDLTVEGQRWQFLILAMA